MHPIVRVAPWCCVAACLGASARAPDAAEAPRAQPVRVAEATLAAIGAPCPRGTIPDGDACVRLPEATADDGDELAAAANVHLDARGRIESYDQIPRAPSRPESFAAYAWPIAPPKGGLVVLSGYDLDRPDAEQRRGPGLSFVGHGGVDLADERGAEVRAVALEHQDGDADVVFAGRLFGTSVVTRHAVREGGRRREYLVMHGHLDEIAPGIERGARAPAGALLGRVGDSGSPGIVHLHVEARRLRDGVDPLAVPETRLMANDVAVVCDPRNVFPLR